MELIRVTPNRERVKSILETTILIEKRIRLQDNNSMSSLIIADYYEIIKELLTALLLLDGYKTLSHKDLFDYAKEYYGLGKKELYLMDELRIIRNRISYEGFKPNPEYLKRNEDAFKRIIGKLRMMIEQKLD